mmetsp:Transcript_117707/g.375145  ORF Transcript_117707/g.375145 Transcript_117707/m.375145 type:complete len:230 (+) Transcript_117707:272-961(+)
MTDDRNAHHETSRTNDSNISSRISIFDLCKYGFQQLAEGLKKVAVPVELLVLTSQFIGNQPALVDRDQGIVFRMELHDPARVFADRSPIPRPAGRRVVAARPLAFVPQIAVACGHEDQTAHRRCLGEAHGGLGAAGVADQNGVRTNLENIPHEGQPDGSFGLQRIRKITADDFLDGSRESELVVQPTVPVAVHNVVATIAGRDHTAAERAGLPELNHLLGVWLLVEVQA